MFARIANFLYPPACVLCGQHSLHAHALCDACMQDIIRNRHACARCALPLHDTSPHTLCGRCLRREPAFDTAWSPFIYAQPLEWMIQQAKFNTNLAVIAVLAEMLCTQYPSATRPDCIIPVPLHASRLRQRGYNQSVELIRPLAQQQGIEMDTHSCQRLRATEPQLGMSAKQRRQNMRDAFGFENRRGYQHVVLFDDVMTTGSTLNELALLLKRKGVHRVDAWSLARAPRHERRNKKVN
jgi:ComF family protein